jgi:mitochondrial inner membrane protease subunit 1
MLPTLAMTGDWVLQKCFGHLYLSRGDIIVYISPSDPHNLVCKRVLGLPGDIICVDPTGARAPSTEHVVVPKGHVWTMGDNAPWSRDSRDYGPVSMGLIRGKAVARVCLYLHFYRISVLTTSRYGHPLGLRDFVALSPKLIKLRSRSPSTLDTGLLYGAIEQSSLSILLHHSARTGSYSSTDQSFLWATVSTARPVNTMFALAYPVYCHRGP